jgi:hypothetical protein
MCFWSILETTYLGTGNEVVIYLVDLNCTELSRSSHNKYIDISIGPPKYQ